MITFNYEYFNNYSRHKKIPLKTENLNNILNLNNIILIAIKFLQLITYHSNIIKYLKIALLCNFNFK